MVNSPRTDLASEARRLFERGTGDLTALRGVQAREETMEGLPVTAVEILDAEGARALGKPVGRYFSLALPRFPLTEGADFQNSVQALAMLLRRCLPEHPGSCLIAALGNPDVTPDALGPLAAEHILVTRHLMDQHMISFSCSVALCRTGVLGTTGMESFQHMRALCGAIRPDCVLVIDALAGAEQSELCRVVQVCDAGIAPGSGVGNDREEFSASRLGVPVVALGVPTVMDAGEGQPYFVTPRYIDSAVRGLGRLLGFAVNRALQPQLGLDDLRLLLD